MTTLVKRNRHAERTLISDKGELDISPAGVAIRFPQPDGRKPSYAVFLDDAAVKAIKQSGENEND